MQMKWRTIIPVSCAALSSNQNFTRRMPLHLTFVVMLFCFSSISTARVVLSLYALDLGASPSAVGLLVATFYAFPLIISWPVGRLSDRGGSRWLLLFGTACGTTGMLVPFFIRNLTALYVAGTMIGLAFSFYNVLLQNLVGMLSKPHERAKNFSNSSLVGASTNFAGPLLAGFAIDHSGHAAACLYVVGLSLGAATVLLAWGRILPQGKGRAGSPGGIRDTLADRDIVRILATSSLVQVGQDLYQFYIPVYGHGIGLSASAIGGVLGTFAAAAFVVRFAMPRLIARLGEERLLANSFYVAACGFFLVPFFHSAFTLCVIAFMFGLGMGCGQPITTMLIFSRSAEGRSGETLGLRQTVNNTVRVSAPALFGFVASAFGLPAVFWINALMMGGGGLLTRRSKPSQGKGA
jgi:MFS family permease